MGTHEKMGVSINDFPDPDHINKIWFWLGEDTRVNYTSSIEGSMAELEEYLRDNQPVSTKREQVYSGEMDKSYGKIGLIAAIAFLILFLFGSAYVGNDWVTWFGGLGTGVILTQLWARVITGQFIE